MKTITKKGFGDAQTLSKVAILSSIAYIVMLIEFPLPFFPTFLKFDFSDVPAIMASFLIHPLAGVIVEGIKNLLHFITKTQTAGVGELGNFLVGSTIAFSSAVIFNKIKKIDISILIGTLIMSFVAAFFNIFVLIPFYEQIMPIDAIIQMGQAVNSNITSVNTLVFYAIFPFNIIKGILILIVFKLMENKLKHIK